MMRFGFAILAVLSGLALPARAELAYAWVQLLPQGVASVRVITDQPCDQVSGTVALAPRGPDTLQGMDDASGAPLHLCSAEVERAKVAQVTVGGQVLSVPQTAPARVAVIGDTGCRVEGHHRDQRCQSPDWIFDAVSTAVAGAQPDLVVHVGDFVYQWNCHGGTEGCGTDHQLRQWRYWESDFFGKAKGLLAQTPWVFVRGNHEDCSRADRGWRGWTLFFSVGAVETDPGACARDQATHLAHLMSLPKGGAAPALDLLLYDSADEVPFRPEDFDLAKGRADPVWVLTHVPLWSAYQSFVGGMPDTVELVLSGHEHLFELVQVAPGDWVQVVAGASGTKLEDPHRAPPVQFYDKNASDFSFLMIERGFGAPVVMTLCAVTPQGVSAWKSWSLRAGQLQEVPPRPGSCTAG